jgi:hypothetical protein
MSPEELRALSSSSLAEMVRILHRAAVEFESLGMEDAAAHWRSRAAHMEKVREAIELEYDFADSLGVDDLDLIALSERLAYPLPGEGE